MSAEFSVSIALKLAAQQLRAGVQAAVADFRQGMNGIKGAAQDASAGTDAAFKTLGVRSLAQVNTEARNVQAALAAIKGTAGVSGAEIVRATTAAQARMAALAEEARGVGPAMQSGVFGASVLQGAIKQAFAAATIAAFTREILNATIAQQKLLTTLEFVTGSQKLAGEEYAFLKSKANELGLELSALAPAYAKLAAAAKGSGFSTEETRKIFVAFSSAAATLGLSSAELEGVLLAIQQMMSKGTVSAEELRGQLGERLPGAFSLAAKSIGITEAALGKLLETGDLTARQFLGPFADTVQNAFGDKAQQAAAGLQGQLNRLKNSFNDLLLTIGKIGAESAIAAVVRELAAGLEAIKAAINSLDTARVGQMGKAFGAAYDQVKGIVAELIRLAGDVLSTANDALEHVVSSWQLISGSISDSTENVSLFTRSLQGIGVIAGAIRDGIVAIKIAFDLAAGAIFVAIERIFGGIAAVVSKVVPELGKTIRQISESAGDAAAKSFLRAERSIDGFKSATVTALEATTEGAKKSTIAIAEFHQELVDATRAATAAETASSAQYAASIKALEIDVIKVVVNITSKYAELSTKLVELGQSGKASSAQILEGVRSLAALAQTKEEVTLLSNIVKMFGVEGKLAATDVAKAFDVVSAAANRTAGQVQGELGDAFKRLGVSTSEATDAAAKQAQTDFDKILVSGKATTAALTAAFLKLSGDVVDAFKRLGILPKESLQAVADQAKLDFRTIETSGRATTEALKAAFLQYAKAAIDANNGIVPATVATKAAQLELTDKVNELSPAYQRAAEEAKKSSAGQKEAAREVTRAISQEQDALGEFSADNAAATEQFRDNAVSVAQYFASVVNDVLRQIKELGSEAVAQFQGKTGLFAGFVNDLDGLRAAAKAANEDLARLVRPVGLFETSGFEAYFFKLKKALIEVRASALDAKLRQEEERKAAEEAAAAATKAAEAQRRADEQAAAVAEALRQRWAIIPDLVQLGNTQAARFALGMQLAKKQADPLVEAMRQIAREAKASAESFLGGAVSIHEELLRLEGREAEAAQARFKQRQLELDLEFKLQDARLAFAIATAQGPERQGLIDARQALNNAFHQAKADLDEIQRIQLAQIEEQSKKRQEEQRNQQSAEIRADLIRIQQAVEQQRAQQQQLTSVQLQAVQEEARQREQMRAEDLRLALQAVEEERQARARALGESAQQNAQQLTTSSLLDGVAANLQHQINAAAMAPGGRGGLVPVQDNRVYHQTFQLDASDLLSPENVRRKVFPVIKQAVDGTR